MTGNHSKYLPQDILIKILHFLPFSSILQCKCVSKEWKSLINDPKFYNLYHDKSLTLFISKGSIYCVLISQGGNKLSINPPCTVHRIPIEFRDERDAVLLVSQPSNWVACVGLSNKDFLFYNLFTGTSHRVVDSPISNLIQGGIWWFGDGWTCYGFSYDRYDDDYKIMVVCDYNAREYLMEDKSQFWVYGLRNHAWKAHQGFPYGAYVWSYKNRACSIDGVLHWVFRRSEDQKDVIVTYDLHTSRFGELSEVPVHQDIWWYRLVELGGQLCCSITNQHEHCMWMMKEYGVKESWTKLFSIEEPKYGYITSMILSSTRDVGLYESRDGKKNVLFLWSDKELILYDMEHGYTQVVEYDECWKVKRMSSRVCVGR